MRMMLKEIMNVLMKLLPKLTKAECKLLMENKKCFKCYHFYIKHMFKDCPNSWLDVNVYKTLTVVNAAATVVNK